MMALLIAVIYPSVLTFTYFVLLAESPAGFQQGVYGVGKILQFGFPVVWVLWFLRQPLRIERPKSTGIWLGLVFSVVVVAAMLLLYFSVLKPQGLFDSANEQIRAKVAGFGIGSFTAYLGLGLFYSLCHSLLEEYYWRWFVFGRLRSQTSFVTALLVSSFGFMLHHVILLGFFFGWASPMTYLFSLAVAIGGCFWAWLYERTGTLYAPWMSHLVIDAGIFMIGYDVVRDML